MNYRKVPFGDLATDTTKLKKLYTEDLQLDIRSGCVAVYTGEEVNCIDELTDDRIIFYKQGYVDEKGIWQNKDEDLHTAKLLYEVNRFIRVLFVENERLKSERDKAVELTVKLMKIFVIPQKDYDKYFRKLRMGAGDYMGTGYAVMDAFYRVYDDFVESADDDLYCAVKRGLEDNNG